MTPDIDSLCYAKSRWENVPTESHALFCRDRFYRCLDNIDENTANKADAVYLVCAASFIQALLVQYDFFLRSEYHLAVFDLITGNDNIQTFLATPNAEPHFAYLCLGLFWVEPDSESPRWQVLERVLQDVFNKPCTVDPRGTLENIVTYFYGTGAWELYFAECNGLDSITDVLYNPQTALPFQRAAASGSEPQSSPTLPSDLAL